MKTWRSFLVAAAVVTIVGLPAFAMAPKPNSPTQYRGVPGPLVGAGLPFLAIGYGVYWLSKRRRKQD